MFADESIEEVKQEISTLQDTQTKIESSTRQTNKHKEAVLNTKRMLLQADDLAKKSKENQDMLQKIESLVDEVDQVISANRPDSVKGLTSEPIMKRLGMIEMYIRNQLAAKGKRAGTGRTFRTVKGKVTPSFGKDSKAEAQLHKRLVTDDIFNDDWSEEDSDPNDGAGIFPYSWQMTNKIVMRHFRNKRKAYKRYVRVCRIRYRCNEVSGPCVACTVFQDFKVKVVVRRSSLFHARAPQHAIRPSNSSHGRTRRYGRK